MRILYQQFTKTAYASPSNLVTGWKYENTEGEKTMVTFPEGNSINYAFDTSSDPLAHGNMISMTRHSLNSAEITVTYTYTTDFHQVNSSKDGNGNITNYDFSAEGNLLRIEYPDISEPVAQNNVESSFGYDSYGRMVSSEDQAGIKTAYEYYTTGAGYGYLKKIIRDDDGLEAATEYGRDNVGNATWIKDPRLNTTGYDIDVLDRIITTTYPNNYVEGYGYDNNGNRKQIKIKNIDEEGNWVSPNWVTSDYGFDALDKVIGITQTNESALTQYSRDGLGNVELFTQPEGNKIETEYNELNLPKRIIEAADNQITTTVKLETWKTYDKNGNLTFRRLHTNSDPKGEIGYEYDGFDRLVKTTDGVGNYTINEYDSNSNITRVARYDSSDVLLAETDYSFDELNRCWKTVENKFDTPGGTGNQADVTTTYYFDLKGRCTSITKNRGGSTITIQTTVFDNLDRVESSEDAEGYLTEYEYDLNGNPLITTLTLSASPLSQTITTRIFDSLNRCTSVTDTSGNTGTTQNKYDSRNNLKTVIDKLGNETYRTYNSLNHLTGIGYKLSPNKTIWILYGRDKNGRLTSLTDDNNNVTYYGFDDVNRKIWERLPDSTIKSYTFNDYGLVDTITDPNGTVVTFGYDNALRQIGKTMDLATGVAGPESEIFEYDGLNRMTKAQNLDGSEVLISEVNMNHDSLGNKYGESLQIGLYGSVKSVASVFDTMSFRTDLTYPSNSIHLEFTPDNLNRTTEIVDSSMGSIAGYDYFGPSLVKEKRFGSVAELTVTYDVALRPVNYEHRKINNDLIVGFAANFDNENNKLYEKRLHETRNSNVIGDAYKYDNLYRVVGVKYEEDDLDPLTAYDDYSTYASKQDFTLDGVGNRNTVATTTGGSTVTSTYVANALNQYNTITTTNPITTTCTWDANGNLRTSGDGTITKTFTYDYANHLLSVTAGETTFGEYLYDALGRRIQKIAGAQTTKYYFDGDRCIEERDGYDALVKSFIYGNGIDEVIAVYQSSALYYFHENSLGTIYGISDSSGDIVETYKYTAYGKVTLANGDPITESQIGNLKLFTGREFDPETGLFYYRARYYSTEMGRFINRDPKEDDNLSNLYTYCLNNPGNYLDPFGEDSSITVRGGPFGSIGGGIGGNKAKGSIGGSLYIKASTKDGGTVTIGGKLSAEATASAGGTKTKLSAEGKGEINTKGEKKVSSSLEASAAAAGKEVGIKGEGSVTKDAEGKVTKDISGSTSGTTSKEGGNNNAGGGADSDGHIHLEISIGAGIGADIDLDLTDLWESVTHEPPGGYIPSQLGGMGLGIGVLSPPAY